MPEFFHERKDAKALFQTLAAEKGYPAAVVEKDYWVMHCLCGLQKNGPRFEMKGGTSLSKGWDIIQRFSEDIDIRFDPPASLNIKGEKPAHIAARFGYYDDLAAQISIPGIKTARNRTFDDEKAQNGGISLQYSTCFDPLPGLKPEVLLEAGFAKTAPNEPRDFSSWALDKALVAGLAVIDNRAPAVKCFNPEYTFVDKLQTICRRFRQHRDRNHAEQDRPRQFMRHYYDLFMLLGVERVRRFIGTAAYAAYKTEKINGADASEFAARTPFTLQGAESFALFDKEFDSMNTLLLGPGPKFREVVARLREHSPTF